VSGVSGGFSGGDAPAGGDDRHSSVPWTGSPQKQLRAELLTGALTLALETLAYLL
jgi:hypothetical protein